MLAEPLEALGAEILFVPVIEIADPAESSSLEQAIQNLASYDWLIFTSVNGVRHFVEALDRSDRDLRDLRAKLCAIGSATRAAIEALHLRVDVMPEEYVAESLLEALAGEDLKASAFCCRARRWLGILFRSRCVNAARWWMWSKPIGPSFRRTPRRARKRRWRTSRTGSRSPVRRR